MEAYKKWVWRNREYVQSLGSLANGLTWLLPEKFSASDIGPEAVSSIFGMITTIHEHIIETAPSPVHVGSSDPDSPPYPLFISILKDLETLVEVVAEHYYGDKKWNFIVFTEAMKVIFRLALFRNSGYKMLLHGGGIPNDGKDTDSSDLQNRTGGSGKLDRSQGPYNFGNYNHHNQWNSEGRAMTALSRFGQNAKMASNSSWSWRDHHQHQHSVTQLPSPAIERPTLSMLLSEKGICGALFVMGETLFIIRPLIYVLFIRKYGIRSWVPWTVSLAVDIFGMGILTQVANAIWWGEKGKQVQFLTAEKDELKRRKLLWALYLMRDPFFTKYTRQKLKTAQKTLEPVPMIGFLTDKIVELLAGAQSRYTYMSGS
ncbi:PREDICTED: peroxisome biogenesis protein 16 isoform X2 [Tarenaya hassleriana]|uniref:peroxisome biogenesis protein 16 isoform X2 n=1 Tax=Tarenaya hassleriana TaxID=28532 RepID=UPI00053C17E5|nr:PREDICTED: peroxisome biogenesis protein 16 isoform X2 [Tarenaya hassleriana]